MEDIMQYQYLRGRWQVLEDGRIYAWRLRVDGFWGTVKIWWEDFVMDNLRKMRGEDGK